MHLGRRRRRLHSLRLAAKGVDSISRWIGNDRRVFFYRQRAADVAGLSRHHVRRLVAAEAGILKRVGTWLTSRDRVEFGRRRASPSETKNREPVSGLPVSHPGRDASPGRPSFDSISSASRHYLVNALSAAPTGGRFRDQNHTLPSANKLIPESAKPMRRLFGW